MKMRRDAFMLDFDLRAFATATVPALTPTCGRQSDWCRRRMAAIFPKSMKENAFNAENATGFAFI